MSAESQQASSSLTNSFSKLEPVIWRKLLLANDIENYAISWLTLACSYIDHIQSGVVVVGEPDVGPFSPVAFWPDEKDFDKEISVVAERAMKEKKGVALTHSNGLSRTIAFPFVIDGQLLGVIAVKSGAGSQPQLVLRQLQWASSWIESFLRRQQLHELEDERNRAETTFDMLASVLEYQHFNDACHSVVTELAMRLECDPVSIGFIKRDHVEIKAISHAAQFGKRMNLIHAISTAMQEAIDQETVILYPSPDEWEYRIVTAHEELCSVHQAGCILTVPLAAHGKIIGALTFERPGDNPFNETEVEVCDAIAAINGPVLEEKRLNDRWVFQKLTDSFLNQLHRLMGPRYFGRKLAAFVMLLLVVFFSVFEEEYKVSSPAILEGEVQRAVVAPFDGYLASQYVRPGEIVKKDQVLASLDDRDLKLERLRWITTERQRATEFDRAMAEHERAQANIAQAQMDQANAQVRLLDEQLARTRIKSPFNAIVVEGDLSQKVGGVLQRGEELFKLAPLNAYRVVLEVDEFDIADLQEGQTGQLRLASMPGEKQTYVVKRITPIAEQKDGRNYFRVEATLDTANERLRPGMEGIGKTGIDERLLIEIWTRRLVAWLRLTLWEWMP